MPNPLETISNFFGAGETREAQKKTKETRNIRAELELPPDKKGELDKIATDLRNQIAFEMLPTDLKEIINKKSILSMYTEDEQDKLKPTPEEQDLWEYARYKYSGPKWEEHKNFNIMRNTNPKKAAELNKKRVLSRNQYAFNKIISEQGTPEQLQDLEKEIKNWKNDEGYFLMMISHDQNRAQKINGGETLSMSSDEANEVLDVMYPNQFLDCEYNHRYPLRPNFLGMKFDFSQSKTFSDPKEISREILAPHTYKDFKPALSKQSFWPYQ
jgi:hypothetical protein